MFSRQRLSLQQHDCDDPLHSCGLLLPIQWHVNSCTVSSRQLLPFKWHEPTHSLSRRIIFAIHQRHLHQHMPSLPCRKLLPCRLLSQPPLPLRFILPVLQRNTSFRLLPVSPQFLRALGRIRLLRLWQR